MTERAIKGVLFDLDGVLIDTEGTYTQFWEAVDRHFPTGVEGFAQVAGGGIKATVDGRRAPDEAGLKRLSVVHQAWLVVV